MTNPDPKEIEKHKIKAILESVREGIIIADLNQNVKEFNKAAENLTGYQHGEVIGKPIGEILRFFDFETEQELQPDMYCPAGEIEKEGIICSRAAVTLIDRHNENKNINLVTRKIRYGPEADLGCIIVIDNIHEQEELERMKLDFIGMSEHILRTPITLVRGYLHNLNNEKTVNKLDETEQENLTKAVNSVTELKDLVENLLSLTEISQGRLTLDLIKTSIEELAKTVIGEYKPQADDKGVGLIYVPPLYEVPLLRLDIMKVLEVLRNLVSNAVKFTEQGQIEVRILKENEFVKVSVKDTGRGIPAQNLPHIFSKFYRIKKPLEMDSSAGLGLFVSKRIIEAHGGSITVESVEGEGSTFNLTFPVH